jgi:aminoglycoside 2''-phosphotransferase
MEKPGNKNGEDGLFSEIGDYRIEIPIASAQASIEQAFPDFEIKSIRALEGVGGLGNVIYLVNEEYIFRFARHAKADRSLAHEVAALPEIEKSLNIPIPHIEYVGRQQESGLGFVGYRMLEGEGLWPELVRDAGGKIKEKFPKRLGQFFNELHAFDVARARELGVREISYPKEYELQLSDAKEKLFPALDQYFPTEAYRIKAWIEKTFKKFFTEREKFGYTPTVIHGDLEAEHILYDRERDDISGIIDFGGLGIGDPDYDLWRPYSHYGREFIEKLLETYPHKNSELLFEKMEFFWSAQLVRRAVRPLAVGDTEKFLKACKRLKERVDTVQ